MTNKCYRPAGVLALALLLAAGTAAAQVSQTIVVDGTNDFDPSNQIETEAGDTEYTEIDLVDLYVTNDAVNLFVGYGYDRGAWGQNQIGIAIDVGTAIGGTTDPWSRQIEWSTAVNRPDFILYCNLDNNWQEGWKFNPGPGIWERFAQGPGSLGWVTNTTFGEVGVLLSTLGVSAGATIGVEAWTTQDNTQRGALDMFANDAVQLSTPTGTVWAPTTPVAASLLHPFTVLSATDTDPPVIDSVRATAHPITTGLDVVFNEPVDQTTAETSGNYALTDGGPIGVVSATRDAVDLNVVHLVLASPLAASASLYDLTVSNVEDLAGNPIGAGNEACFMVKELVIRGLFSFYLQNNSSPPDEFAVEGALLPLTFGPICDTGNMVDTGVDDIWEWSGLFLVEGDCVAGTATYDMEWKFTHNCTTYESFLGNRVHTLDLADGATDTIEVWWNDEDPSSFLTRDVDVEFFVDMNGSGIAPGDTVSINGDTPPLTYDVPSVTQLVDDGTGNDAIAGDGIYSTVVRFEPGASKDVLYKFLLNSAYECSGGSDRHVYVNEDEFGVIGSPEGPLTLPVAIYDFCGTIWNPVDVIFRADMSYDADLQPTDVISVNGTANGDPAFFSWDVPSLNDMADDGVYPDAVAGDLIYTKLVSFPVGSQQVNEYKYLINDAYECLFGNRQFVIDPDTYDNAGNPQVLDVDTFRDCEVSDVPGVVHGLALDQNRPNPFNPTTTIRFHLPRAGHARLRVYSARGELVATLVDEMRGVGYQTVDWNGRDDRGAGVASGVYFYRLEAAGKALTRRMLLLK